MPYKMHLGYQRSMIHTSINGYDNSPNQTFMAVITAQFQVPMNIITDVFALLQTVTFQKSKVKNKLPVIEKEAFQNQMPAYPYWVTQRLINVVDWNGMDLLCFEIWYSATIISTSPPPKWVDIKWKSSNYRNVVGGTMLRHEWCELRKFAYLLKMRSGSRSRIPKAPLQLSYNCSPQTSTSAAPFQLVFSRTAPPMATKVDYSQPNYPKDLKANVIRQYNKCLELHAKNF